MTRPLAHPIQGIPLVGLAPFSGATHLDLLTNGEWLDQAIARLADLPDRFQTHGIVYVAQGAKLQEVPRHFWARGKVSFRLRLKPVEGAPVRVILAMAPGRGGAGKGGKSLITIVATLALLAVGTFITGGGLAGLLGTGFAAGSTGAQALAAGVTFLGRLAISLAAKPAGRSSNDATDAGLGSASASGNVVAPGQSFDYVAGRVKCFPKMASYPLVELEGDDELVEASYMFEGPHELRDIKLEGTRITEVTGVTFIADEGTSASPVRLLQRYGYQTTPQIELKAHARDKVNVTRLANQGAPEASLPQPTIVTSKNDPDEIWLQLLWPANFGTQSGGTEMIMPFRLKMRIQGTDQWINLPELMFHSSTTGRMSKKIVLKWQAAAPSIVDQPFKNGAWHSFHTVPVQNLPSPNNGVGGWNAHASFVGGAAINATARVERRTDGFVVYLDPAVFPRGHRWDVSIMRGCITAVNDWAATAGVVDPTTYTIASGFIYSLFDYFNQAGIYYTANGTQNYTTSTVESCILMRVASVWNRPPLPKPGNATIEVRGRNVNVTQLSVLAAALVAPWNGTRFEGVAPSENPADHYFEVLTGQRTAKPLREDLVNVPQLGQWHAENETAGRKVALILSGRTWEDSLDAIASAGLARRQEGRFFGITRSRDTFSLGVAQRQVFNHLNMISFNWVKSFDTTPDAVRVSFRNRALDFEQDERLVMRPGLTAGDVKLIVQQEADAIADEAQLVGFYELYLQAAYYRDHLFTLETWFEGVAAEPGDIICVNDMILEETHVSARISQVLRDGAGDITGLVLDTELDANIETGLESVAALEAVDDLRLQGVSLGCMIMTSTGITVQPIDQVDAGELEITFEAPFTNPDVAEGQVVSIGRRGLEAHRFEVTDIEPSAERFFTLTLAPEAPEMWS
jgi:hypothetical protein